jgi:hypothetical protein
MNSLFLTERDGFDGLGGFQTSMYICLTLLASGYKVESDNGTKRTV